MIDIGSQGVRTDSEEERPPERPSLREGGRLFALGALLLGAGPMLIGLLTPWGFAAVIDQFGFEVSKVLLRSWTVPWLAMLIIACIATVVAGSLTVLSRRRTWMRRSAAAAIVLAGAMIWSVFSRSNLCDYVSFRCRAETFGFPGFGYLVFGGFFATMLGLVALLRVGSRQSQRAVEPLAVSEAPPPTEPVLQRPDAGPARSGDVKIAWGLGIVAVGILVFIVLVLILAMFVLSHGSWTTTP